jgi:hypothetical protein
MIFSNSNINVYQDTTFKSIVKIWIYNHYFFAMNMLAFIILYPFVTIVQLSSISI